jgi:hypothetical protein
MNRSNLDKLFGDYPEKVRQLIEETKRHGDPYFAARVVYISDRQWITDLIEYDGVDATRRKAQQDLLEAIDIGRQNREKAAKQIFLETLELHASIPEAVRSQPWYDRSQFDDWREGDQLFADAWKNAYETAIDTLRLEAWRRAVNGVDEPLMHRGQLIKDEEKLATVKKYSDPLLMMLLKRYDAEFNNDRVKIEQTTNAKIEDNSKRLSPRVLAQMSEAELKVLGKFYNLQNAVDDESE